MMTSHSDTDTDMKEDDCLISSPQVVDPFKYWVPKLAELCAVARGGKPDAIEHHLLRLLYLYEVKPCPDQKLREVGLRFIKSWPTAFALVNYCEEDLSNSPTQTGRLE
jgi:hypothetical protein